MLSDLIILSRNLSSVKGHEITLFNSHDILCAYVFDVIRPLKRNRNFITNGDPSNEGSS